MRNVFLKNDFKNQAQTKSVCLSTLYLGTNVTWPYFSPKRAFQWEKLLHFWPPKCKVTRGNLWKHGFTYIGCNFSYGFKPIQFPNLKLFDKLVSSETTYHFPKKWNKLRKQAVKVSGYVLTTLPKDRNFFWSTKKFSFLYFKRVDSPMPITISFCKP